MFSTRPAPAGGFAADRVTRVLAAATGVAGLLFPLAAAGLVAAQTRVLAPWWTVAAALGALGVPALTVADDGVGFDPARVDQRRLGIAVGMRARAALIDGAEVAVTSAPRAGTTVTVRWQGPA